MRIEIIDGYLTASEKKVVKHMLDNEISAGKAGKRNFFIVDKGEYTEVKIKVIDRGLIPCPGSPLRTTTYKHRIKLCE